MRKLAITVSALAIVAASFGCKARTDYNQPSGQGGGPQSGHQMGEDYKSPPGMSESTESSGSTTESTGSASGSESSDRTLGGEGSTSQEGSGIGGGPSEAFPSSSDNTRPGTEGFESLGGKDAGSMSGGSELSGGKDAGSVSGGKDAGSSSSY